MILATLAEKKQGLPWCEDLHLTEMGDVQSWNVTKRGQLVNPRSEKMGNEWCEHTSNAYDARFQPLQMLELFK